MPNSAEITPLSEVMEDLNESHLRASYSEFLSKEPTPLGESRRRGKTQTKPDREKISSEFREELDGGEFIRAQFEGELLEGAERPSFVIQKEKPEHRYLVFLFAQGRNVKEVFLDLGGVWDDEKGTPVAGTGQWSYGHLINIRKQTWFQKAIITFLNECGMDLLQAKMKAECAASIDTVVELRDSLKAPAAVRLNAAKDIMDRFLGKPTQKVEVVQTKGVSDYENELLEIQKEEERLKLELKNLNPGLV